MNLSNPKTTAFYIWTTTSLVSSIFMGITSYYKWQQIDSALAVWGFYFLLGLLCSLHSYFILTPILKLTLKKKLRMRIFIFILTAIAMTLISFLPFFYLYFSLGIHFKINTRHFFSDIIPLYTLSAVIVTILYGQKFTAANSAQAQKAGGD